MIETPLLTLKTQKVERKKLKVFIYYWEGKKEGDVRELNPGRMHPKHESCHWTNIPIVGWKSKLEYKLMSQYLRLKFELLIQTASIALHNSSLHEIQKCILLRPSTFLCSCSHWFIWVNRRVLSRNSHVYPKHHPRRPPLAKLVLPVGCLDQILRRS